MSNTYIKIKVLPYGTQKNPDSIGTRFVKTILTTIVPLANPDFDKHIKEAAFWLIEFEGDSFYPNREIGLNINGDPIMIMPWKKNYGYWTDNNLVLKDFRSNFETIDVSKEEFEKLWKLFESEN